MGHELNQTEGPFVSEREDALVAQLNDTLTFLDSVRNRLMAAAGVYWATNHKTAAVEFESESERIQAFVNEQRDAYPASQ